MLYTHTHIFEDWWRCVDRTDTERERESSSYLFLCYFVSAPMDFSKFPGFDRLSTPEKKVFMSVATVSVAQCSTTITACFAFKPTEVGMEWESGTRCNLSTEETSTNCVCLAVSCQPFHLKFGDSSSRLFFLELWIPNRIYLKLKKRAYKHAHSDTHAHTKPRKTQTKPRTNTYTHKHEHAHKHTQANTNMFKDTHTQHAHPDTQTHI